MDSAGCRIRETGTGLMVPLHVQPRARQTQIAGIHNGALKVKISAPPVDDAANRAIVEYFSKTLCLPKSHVRIVAGQKSRDKLLHISGISLQTFQALLR
jgi:hypothetical protein